MSTPSAEAFEPDDDLARGFAEIEGYLATQLPQEQKKTPVRPSERAPFSPKVHKLKNEVLEAHELVKWQADNAPSLVESEKVRNRRRKVKEAAALRKLDEDPDMIAWRDLRAQRRATMACMTGVVIALLISSAGVQDSVAKALKAPEHSVLWWFAFLTESAMSLPLLSVVATKAYAAMRGLVVDRKSAEGKAMFRTEVWLLAYTLTLQCWPVLSGDFSFLKLVVHSLAPVVAVLSVWALPAISMVFAQLHNPVTAPPTQRATEGATPPKYSGNTEPAPASHRARVRHLIAVDELPKQPSATQIQKATGCGTNIARQIRDELQDGQ